MKRATAIFLCSITAAAGVFGQGAVRLPEQEQRQRERQEASREQARIAQQAANVEIVGNTAFSENELRTRLREQIAAIAELGLTAPRADDAAFFLELYYRQRGYADATVRYVLPGGNRLRLEITEGPLVTISNIHFIGNYNQPADKLFDYVVGPTRERVARGRAVPFVARDLAEGADLVHRVYVAEGYLDSIVQEPHFRFSPDRKLVEVSIAIVEGRQYSFGEIMFDGQTVFPREELLVELRDVLVQPYTEGRVSDIPRRLQAFFKQRGYYAAKVAATGNPEAARAGAVPVRVTISPGLQYEFAGATVTGLERLRPEYVRRRFTALNGRTYSPRLVDERFRKLMRSGLFNILQVHPVPIEGTNELLLQVTAEEARHKEVGISLGYGTYVGAIVGASFRDRNLFGYGRPITLSGEWTQRGYRGEILFEDPYLLGTENELRVRLYALTFDFEGYEKFELGARVEVSRQLTRQYNFAAFATSRHVEVTTAEILPEFLGRASYLANSIGFSHTLDLRESPLVNPRGLVVDHTFDLASDVLGSQVEFVRSTLRLSYYLSFAPPVPTPGTVGIDTRTEEGSGFLKWFQRSSLAFGARVGIIKALHPGAEDQVFDLPIDERFFNGGSSTVRSFTERDLGPTDRGYPIGGEFFTVFNVEYTFPIWGEIMGAVFFDAGNLLPNAEDAGLDHMRYGIGAGLRYALPIGPIRLDYAVNPSPRADEPSGAFHFSFGFAF